MYTRYDEELLGSELVPMVPIARKFERFLETYRRPDGRRWGGQDLHNATEGIVTRSYVSNLRKGWIENPGYEKLAAIAKAMGFSPKLWFEEAAHVGATVRMQAADNSQTFSSRVNYLFEVMKNERTGERYTNAEVARMSFGELREEDLESFRADPDPNPPVSKVMALADAFGVHTSYFFDQSNNLPIINQEVLDILRDETVSAIAQKCLHFPEREKQMILRIVQQFEVMHEADHNDHMQS